MTIDEIPLSWFVGRGVVLDFHELDPQLGATDADVQRALADAGHELRPGDVVLIRTDASEHFAEPGYERYGCGLRRSATEWLVDHGVRLIGIDAWTLDRPVRLMAEEAKEGAHDQFWESHYLGAEKPYCHIERLVGLADLPSPTGFFVVALPFRIEAASAGWARVVAIYDKGAV
jgi:kynurenine formamidase